LVACVQLVDDLIIAAFQLPYYSRSRIVHRGTIRLLQKLGKSSLLEVPVSSQGLNQTALLHDDKANAVHETPIFVGPVRIHLPASFVEGFAERNNFDAG
jgi:hypothetical protein